MVSGSSAYRDSIRVEIAARESLSYRVVVGSGLTGCVAELLASNDGFRRALLVVDGNLDQCDVDRVREAIEGCGVATLVSKIDAREAEKSMGTVHRLLGDAAEDGLDRSGSLVVGYGGGITTDIAGFVAASYQRGIPVLQLPTTLLSMVDASTGGKTGVNLQTQSRGLLKNYVGAFHQPIGVIADINMLHSLPQRHLRSGLSECIKHGLLAAGFEGAPRILSGLSDRISGARSRDAGELSSLIADGIRIKSAVVRTDETECSDDPSRSRAVLNLGHTFAHAIETLESLSPTGMPEDAPLTHGEAVSLGLIAAAHTSMALGHVEEESVRSIEEWVELSDLPRRVGGLPANSVLVDRMTRDKKSAEGAIKLVLPMLSSDGSLGVSRVVVNPDRAAIEAGWDSIRAE